MRKAPKKRDAVIIVSNNTCNVNSDTNSDINSNKNSNTNSNHSNIMIIVYKARGIISLGTRKASWLDSCSLRQGSL